MVRDALPDNLTHSQSIYYNLNNTGLNKEPRRSEPLFRDAAKTKIDPAG